MSERKTKAESRRDFLKTAGKLAVYTPPAMMLLTKASAVAVASCPTNNLPNGVPHNGCAEIPE